MLMLLEVMTVAEGQGQDERQKSGTWRIHGHRPEVRGGGTVGQALAMEQQKGIVAG